MGGGSGAETVNPPPSWDLAVLWHMTNLPQSSPRSRREEERFPGGLAPKRSLGSREGSEFWDLQQGDISSAGLTDSSFALTDVARQAHVSTLCSDSAPNLLGALTSPSTHRHPALVGWGRAQARGSELCDQCPSRTPSPGPRLPDLLSLLRHLGEMLSASLLGP